VRDENPRTRKQVYRILVDGIELTFAPEKIKVGRRKVHPFVKGVLKMKAAGGLFGPPATCEYGGGTGTRTPDTWIMIPLL
jgi:hypothetical protein